jgi:hypothetical protein
VLVVREAWHQPETLAQTVATRLLCLLRQRGAVVVLAQQPCNPLATVVAVVVLATVEHLAQASPVKATTAARQQQAVEAVGQQQVVETLRLAVEQVRLQLSPEALSPMRVVVEEHRQLRSVWEVLEVAGRLSTAAQVFLGRTV